MREATLSARAISPCPLCRSAAFRAICRAGLPIISIGFGRYLERLENAARLTRTLLGRLSRAGLLPRDVPELEALSACLVEARMISADIAAGAAPPVLVEMLLRSLSQDGGTMAWLIAQVQRLADTLRDRLSGEMHGMIAHGGRGLKGARLTLDLRRPNVSPAGPAPGASTGLLADFAGRVPGILRRGQRLCGREHGTRWRAAIPRPWPAH